MPKVILEIRPSPSSDNLSWYLKSPMLSCLKTPSFRHSKWTYSARLKRNFQQVVFCMSFTASWIFGKQISSKNCFTTLHKIILQGIKEGIKTCKTANCDCFFFVCFFANKWNEVGYLSPAMHKTGNKKCKQLRPPLGRLFLFLQETAHHRTGFFFNENPHIF